MPSDTVMIFKTKLGSTLVKTLVWLFGPVNFERTNPRSMREWALSISVKVCQQMLVKLQKIIFGLSSCDYWKYSCITVVRKKTSEI